MATKKDIICNIAKDYNLTKKQAEEIFNSILNDIVDSVAEDGGFSVVGFGNFSRVFKAEKKYNGFGKEMVIPEHYVVKFKPGKKFKERVNSKKK